MDFTKLEFDELVTKFRFVTHKSADLHQPLKEKVKGRLFLYLLSDRTAEEAHKRIKNLLSKYTSKYHIPWKVKNNCYWDQKKGEWITTIDFYDEEAMIFLKLML